MDQTKNNLERIRAFDAEEGEWRTINGAHVLIKNGRIAGGAGGVLNGQPFRGGSLKKMQSGSKGMESGAYGRKLKSQAKEVAEKNRAAIARANAKYDRNISKRFEQMEYLMEKASKLPDHSPLEATYRNAYEALARQNQREGRATAATTHALNQEMFDLEGKAARHESNRGEVASRAQRALERYRKSREAERGGASAPQQSAPPPAQTTVAHSRSTRKETISPRGTTAIKANNGDNITVSYNRRTQGYDLSVMPSNSLESREQSFPDIHSLNRELAKNYNMEVNDRPGSSSPTFPRQSKLGRMQPGSTSVNVGKEAKRLEHNARVYHRTARRAREAYNAKMDKSGGEPNAIEQKKNAYKAKSYENVSRRDQAAASAKGRLSKLRQLAKALKARNPNAFKG